MKFDNTYNMLLFDKPLIFDIMFKYEQIFIRNLNISATFININKKL